ncbi:MAG: hypothetical protein TEF_00435 [Rhizobiales bacterium NRL2]|nr:MAG: hypothetical protein TEF_00435 [Rhizobiales bacterium NRL2]
MAIVIWSVLPAVSHAQALLTTQENQLEKAAEHGHSHDLDYDPAHAQHGHGHDAAAHDHSPALLQFGDASSRLPGVRDDRRLTGSPLKPSRMFRIDKPPRA